MNYHPDYSWTQEEMTIIIKCRGQVVMQLSLHEAIESAGYDNIMKHVAECNRTPWLKRWQEERAAHTFEKLKGNRE